MKKVLAMVLVFALVFAFAGCGKNDKPDSELIKDNGKLVVGITDFEPMDYEDENGKWIGFDADLATEFAKSLGVDVEFVEIEWDTKELELDSKNIDCIWNGMTLTDGVKEAMDTSKPYCNNAQVVIVNKDVADQYATADACKELNFAVEAGSAGEDMAKEYGFKYTAVKDQATALIEVAAGTSDAAIIDTLMATAMVGEGTGYANLTYTAKLNSEEYGVGFRKGSDLVEKLNQFFEESTQNGKMLEIANKYGIADTLITE